ncbi:helix-turn-helix domain-containing protein [Actinoallomurus soli]|uniref:helix-turn-helix domain-containing protein n=1 Tax=Actinoallomurus soli TaxID=2952535 RepID=UPI002092B63B|nr:helix-turn-helix domain-containing protein [Actinoallomurus soli]MCO5975030.1 helix-turn-helix domain-containing protein [Actinoallomurus soli]
MTSSRPGSALGEFLRARRARVEPTDFGLPAGTGRRRNPGLRREELATLAGISVDYYIRLEQGKETNPGAAVLRQLAQALRLDHEETGHLFALADRAAGRGAGVRTGQDVRPGIRQLLETLRPCPAYVRNRTNDILAANPEGLALLAGIEDWPPERRNTTRFTFLHPAARALYDGWPAVATAAVAQLRTTVAADPEDPALSALVEELTRASADFAGLWRRHDVRHHHTDRKTFHHPVVGDVTFGYESLGIGPDGQRLAVYQTAPGSPDHEKMRLLALTVEQG